jgi:hypothetical protein
MSSHAESTTAESVRIVGRNYVPESQLRRCLERHPPGLNCSDCTPGHVDTVYRNVTFGATREYVDDNDGWQTVRYRARGRRARQWKGVE